MHHSQGHPRRHDQQLFPQFLLFPGQEAVKSKFSCIHAADGQRGNRRTAAGDRHHGNPPLHRRAHQPIAGVGNAWRARIRGQGYIHVFIQHLLGQRLALALFIMLMTAGQGRINAEMGGKLPRHPRVFRRNQADLFQRFNSPGRHITQVADGRSHNI